MQIVSNVIEPYKINPAEGDWTGNTDNTRYGTALVATIWTHSRLLGFHGRTYTELNILFWLKVSARNLSKYKGNAFENDSHAAVAKE